MGVTADLEEFRRSAERFRGLEPGPAVSWTVPYRSGGPLSDGLAITQDRKARAAAEFVAAKDRGVSAVADGLDRIAGNLDEFDRQGAESIRRLFPEPGGQR